MKNIIAVIGNANIDNDIEKQNFAFQIGKSIIDSGYILATGGLGGVMEFASKGAKSSKSYTQNSIIGILPDYHTENANEYVDLPISTGLGLTRNLILISLSNAVIAIGGGSGTLNEISAAWQMNKLIIALKTSGWSEKLQNQSLDSRRNDIIFGAENPEKAIQILNEKLPQYLKNKFTGVNKTRISQNKAEQIIISHFLLENHLQLLGRGSEGFVFTDNQFLYKLIDNDTNVLDLFWKLSALSETISKYENITAINNFSVHNLEKYLIVKTEFEKSNEFPLNQTIDKSKFIVLLKEFLKIGWVLTDFQPKNIRISKQNNLVVSDIGHSFYPFTNELFKSMCRRAFVTYIIQNKLTDFNSFKKYLSPVNTKIDFSLLTEFDFTIQELTTEFDDFYNKIITTDKKEVLNPIILQLIKNQKEIQSIFDYGSGYGDISQMLKNSNFQVTAFEPDERLIEKYRNTYYQNITILNIEQKNILLNSSQKFDCVLCSLVLCHPLAENEKQRTEIIEKIMYEIICLSNKYILIVICNPLFTNQKKSTLQNRILPENFNYSKTTQFTKFIKSSNRERFDIHRPLSFYENLFEKNNLKIIEINQTNDFQLNSNRISNSDFMLFLLEKL